MTDWHTRLTCKCGAELTLADHDPYSLVDDFRRDHAHCRQVTISNHFEVVSELTKERDDYMREAESLGHLVEKWKRLYERHTAHVVEALANCESFGKWAMEDPPSVFIAREFAVDDDIASTRKGCPS